MWIYFVSYPMFMRSLPLIYVRMHINDYHIEILHTDAYIGVIEQIQFSIECIRDKFMLNRKLMAIDITERSRIYIIYLDSHHRFNVFTAFAAYAFSRFRDE